MKAKPDTKPNRKLSDFRQQAQNLNRHTERGMGMLEQSMQEVGYAAPMVAAADGEILDGSARHETAANVFGADAEPIIVESDGKRPIVVVRTDIKDAKTRAAKRLAAYANRTGQVNLEWDAPNLEALFAEDAEAFKGLFGEDELSNLLKIFQANGVEVPTLKDGDRAPFRQCTFTLHDEQFQEVEAAMRKAKAEGGGESSVNENSNGNALAWICGRFNRG